VVAWSGDQEMVEAFTAADPGDPGRQGFAFWGRRQRAEAEAREARAAAVQAEAGLAEAGLAEAREAQPGDPEIDQLHEIPAAAPLPRRGSITSG
jgi:hypothetical protein